jgi:hypothetical protein
MRSTGQSLFWEDAVFSLRVGATQWLRRIVAAYGFVELPVPLSVKLWIFMLSGCHLYPGAIPGRNQGNYALICTKMKTTSENMLDTTTNKIAVRKLAINTLFQK